ncbi:MAG: AAA family ATPase, partial [Dolichospermum sp.]
MTVEELDIAITQMKMKATSNNLETTTYSPRVTELLKCVKTSCAPIGYTNEAASEARNKMFALWMTFGPPSLLFTFSPCDECSFRMQLHATAEYHNLPTIHEPIEILTRKLGLRKSARVQFPGACAREFDSLLRIVLSELIGWEGLKHKRNGIFGLVNAYAVGVEEQGRTSLHGHIILWILNFLNLQQNLFSTDANVREKSREEVIKYLDQVLSSTFDILQEEVINGVHDEGETCSTLDASTVMEGVSLQNLREMRHRELLKKHKGKVVSCNNCKKEWDTAEVVQGVLAKMFVMAREEYAEYWPDELEFPLCYEQMELLMLRFQFDMAQIPKEKEHSRRFLHCLGILFFNTHDWKHRKGCFKKGNECRFHIPKKPCERLCIDFATNNIEGVVNDDPSTTKSYWYHHDGTHHNVCSYDICTKRQAWDVFVNTNNPSTTKIFGYNNNICIGNINTLYYCTLYTSKSNQEEETYPYVKVLEAVAHRLKRLEERSNEEDLSTRQIGLRTLLSGINSHLSSCVVSATMAWYLVVHGSRFHYSHEFKPLLLSQLESWFLGESFNRRIRYRKKRRRRRNDEVVSGTVANSINVTFQDVESSDTWFESCVDNYIYRPAESTISFENMCLWEYESKFDLVTLKADNFMAHGELHDVDSIHFRFHEDHPGYMYACLAKRYTECIPKLYYSNKFPDIADLCMDSDEGIDDTVRDMREIYARKALLLFYPFRDKQDLLGEKDSLWEFFIEQKHRLSPLTTASDVQLNDEPKLYQHALQILQNIQDLLNVKKIPSSEEMLQSCTTLSPDGTLGRGLFADDHDDCNNNNIERREEEEINVEAQIQQLTNYINQLASQNSIFNNTETQQICNQKVAEDPSLVQISPSLIMEQIHGGHGFDNNGFELEGVTDNVIDHEETLRASNTTLNNRPVRSMITVLTRALETDNMELGPIHNFHELPMLREGDNDNVLLPILQNSMQSMQQCSISYNLDRKQTIAFQTICSTFMLSFLIGSSSDISSQDIELYGNLLTKKGAKQQLLMCLTGPGGSGKSHVIKCCRLYCKSFCDAIGKPFTFSVFPVTATSNAAASLINGITIHSAALLNNKYIHMDLSTDVNWTMSKMLVVDEISMADKKIFHKMDRNLRILTGHREKLFGGLNIVYGGDFMQLAPVQGTAIYNSFEDILWHQSLNAAVFLDERNHRFNSDPLWGEILGRVQLGIPTDDDIKVMNDRLLGKVDLPSNVDCDLTKIVYGCYSNKKRNEITNACFLKYIINHNPLYDSSMEPPQDTLLIKGIVTVNNRDVGPEFHKVLWSICGDDDVMVGKTTRIDPCLKLIIGSPLMLITNTEKKRKLVKGMTGNYAGIKWKPGREAHVENYHGYKVNCCHVTDIDCIVLKLHTGDRIVEIQPEMFQPSIKFPGSKSTSPIKGYSILQFPVNHSLAVTGHKLQG